jgi:hypothetical protein
LSKIKDTFGYKYIKYGAQATYQSAKSKPVPVPQRSYISKRSPWYDLDNALVRGFAFWPKGSQYRHIVIANPDNLIGNCRLNCLAPREGSGWDRLAFAGVLNCTMVAFFSKFYGRYTGTEGAIELMVGDVSLIDVPNPSGMTDRLSKRLKDAFKALCKRDIGDVVEASLKEAHSYERAMNIAAGPITLPDELTQPDRRELDDAVFELLGVTDAAERARLIDRLYEAVTLHFRDIRVTEIQKMEDRRKGDKAKFSTTDLAADAWDAIDLADLTPLAEWVKANAKGDCEEIEIPSERPVQLDSGGMFDTQTVYFGKARRQHIVCASRGQAELIARIATLQVTGGVCVPRSNEHTLKLLDALNHRHALAAKRLRELAESRSGDAAKQDEVFALLERWYVLGKPASSNRGQEAAVDDAPA